MEPYDPMMGARLREFADGRIDIARLGDEIAAASARHPGDEDIYSRVSHFAQHWELDEVRGARSAYADSMRRLLDDLVDVFEGGNREQVEIAAGKAMGGRASDSIANKAFGTAVLAVALGVMIVPLGLRLGAKAWRKLARKA